MSGVTYIFVGGPWDGKVQAYHGPWPMHVSTGVERPLNYWAEGRLVPEGMSYHTMSYFPVRFHGLNLAITEEHRRYLEAKGGMPDGSMTRAALRILYDAVHADHNDPTDDSEQALECAFEFAEHVLAEQPQSPFQYGQASLSLSDKLEADFFRAIRQLKDK